MGKLSARLGPTIVSVSSDAWTNETSGALEKFEASLWTQRRRDTEKNSNAFLRVSVSLCQDFHFCKKKFPTNIASIPDE
jgi:hypothetical protein